jgi:hypothetical protein
MLEYYRDASTPSWTHDARQQSKALRSSRSSSHFCEAILPAMQLLAPPQLLLASPQGADPCLMPSPSFNKLCLLHDTTPSASLPRSKRRTELLETLFAKISVNRPDALVESLAEAAGRKLLGCSCTPQHDTQPPEVKVAASTARRKTRVWPGALESVSGTMCMVLGSLRGGFARGLLVRGLRSAPAELRPQLRTTQLEEVRCSCGIV